jgi:hypothetical protein
MLKVTGLRKHCFIKVTRSCCQCVLTQDKHPHGVIVIHVYYFYLLLLHHCHSLTFLSALTSIHLWRLYANFYIILFDLMLLSLVLTRDACFGFKFHECREPVRQLLYLPDIRKDLWPRGGVIK